MPSPVCAPVPLMLLTTMLPVPALLPAITTLSDGELSSPNTLLNTNVPPWPTKSPLTLRVLKAVPSPSLSVPVAPSVRSPMLLSPVRFQVAPLVMVVSAGPVMMPLRVALSVKVSAVTAVSATRILPFNVLLLTLTSALKSFSTSMRFPLPLRNTAPFRIAIRAGCGVRVAERRATRIAGPDTPSTVELSTTSPHVLGSEPAGWATRLKPARIPAEPPVIVVPSVTSA
ncbi:hypothetical protein D3C71_1064530 [compost metagenome]